jgi:hypothetical protein
MSRLNMIVVALGGFTLAAALPIAVRAQSGDALAKAENACLEHNVGPHSLGFDTCVGRTARAYEMGDPAAAEAEARHFTEARDACLSYDIEPMTLGYRQCIANETNRTALGSYEARYAYRP